MNLIEFKELLKNECKNNKIEYKEDKAEILYKYMRLVQEWNTKVSLTTLNDDIMFCMKHIIDSLSICFYKKNEKNLIDIGTGAGFPGIPLKIYYPEMKVTLIDSVNKKVMVLNDIIEKLELKDIEALHIRAEDLARDKNYREKFDMATTRAVSNLSTISEYMLPFLKVGGHAICMKGPNVEEELKSGEKAINILGGEIEKIDQFNISNQFERKIIVIKKAKPISNLYPRGQGKALKNPLGQ